MNTGKIIDKIGTSINEGIYITLESIYVNNTAEDEWFNKVEINYYANDNCYWFSGYFADQTKEIGKYNYENVIGIDFLRKYYKDEELATRIRNEELKKQQEKAEEEKLQRERDRELSKKIPEPGMTAEDVKKTSWGYPDKINKDTYKWGTTEQWVYKNFGYVYLENGIVTSVSHR